jgi:hypothetical protein
MPTSDDRFEAAKEAIKAVSEESNADLILYSGLLSSPWDSELMASVEGFKSHPNVMLLMTTFGGSADSAFRIARCLQNQYANGKFTLLINTYCKSAGTLLSLGAHGLIMSVTSEMGPLDVQISKPDELSEYTSGLTFKQAIETLRDEAFAALETYFLSMRFRSGQQITTKTAMDVAVQLATGLFSPIFGQIDPSRIGENQRAIQIAQDYGTRLASSNVKDGTVEHLIHHYPSHGFVIDRSEARELFKEVRAPTVAEAKLTEVVKPWVDAGIDGDEPVVVFLNSLLYNVDETDDDEEVEVDETGGDDDNSGTHGTPTSSSEVEKNAGEPKEVTTDEGIQDCSNKQGNETGSNSSPTGRSTEEISPNV